MAYQVPRNSDFDYMPIEGRKKKNCKSNVSLMNLVLKYFSYIARSTNTKSNFG